MSKASQTTEGKGVLKTMDRLHSSGDISLDDLPSGLGGQTKTKFFGGKQIELNRTMDAAFLSVYLVHEAYHAGLDLNSVSYIDQEIIVRTLQGQLASQLVDDGIFCKGNPYKLSKGNASADYYKNDRIIDWVLAIPEYTEEKNFLTSAWILKHLRDWKGLQNRELNTRKMYLEVLLLDPENPDPKMGGDIASAVQEILESEVARLEELVKFCGNGNRRLGADKIAKRVAMGYSLKPGLQKRHVEWAHKTGFADYLRPY